MFDIKIEDAWDQFELQKGKCAYTGVELILTTKYGRKYGLNTASLDRIDSSRGYTIDNIQWVHKKINRIKSNLSEKEFIDWCKKVTDHYEQHNKNPNKNELHPPTKMDG